MENRFGADQSKITSTIVCPKCGNCGVIKWAFVPSPDGPKKDFVGIVGEFYERISRKSPYPLEIACNSCQIVVSSEAPQP
jgi:hypothetical protein